MSEASFPEAARRALDGASVDGVIVHRGRRRGDLGADLSRPLLTVLAAFVLWSMVFLRASMGAGFLDPFALLLRVVALGATIRAFFTLRLAVRTVEDFRAAPRHALALADEGLVVRGRRGERVLPRSRVLGVHAAARGGAPTILLVPERGEALLTLPSGLADPHGRLAEAIDAWLGERPPAATPALPPPGRLASDLYDRAARSELDAGVACIPRGRGWLRQGPYGALLVAVALGERLARLPEGLSLGALGFAALGLCLVLPLAWLVPGLRRARAAKGLAAVLTPEELLVRLPGGGVRAPGRKVTALEIGRRTLWSALGGYEKTRTLYVEKEHGDTLALPDSTLGADPEAVAALIELYREGRIAR